MCPSPNVLPGHCAQMFWAERGGPNLMEGLVFTDLSLARQNAQWSRWDRGGTVLQAQHSQGAPGMLYFWDAPYRSEFRDILIPAGSSFLPLSGCEDLWQTPLGPKELRNIRLDTGCGEGCYSWSFPKQSHRAKPCVDICADAVSCSL